MNTVQLYDSVCMDVSGRVVRWYSTSFNIGIRSLHRRFRDPIRAIYAFVRFADEIVDTFHAHDKKVLLQRFAQETSMAIDERISLNPILHSFQHVVNHYGIPSEQIGTFLNSMEMDLHRTAHDRSSFTTYVLGSAEVVGLICLRVFCEGDEARYERLKPAAMRLGAAFQKVNFLRDLRDDHVALGRSYFPGVDAQHLDSAAKARIEAEIEADFAAALDGIRALPAGCRLGVYIAYVHYRALFRKIQGLSVEHILRERTRIHNSRKLSLLTTSYLRHSFGQLT